MKPAKASKQQDINAAAFGPPLMQSGISEEIWKLLPMYDETFKLRVIDYFARAYPGFTVVRADYDTRTIYLRDDRETQKRKN